MFSSVLPVLLVLLLATTQTKSDCTSGTEFSRECVRLVNSGSYELHVFLTNERADSRLIHNCGCNDPIRWVMSSDHHRTDMRTLNTSLPLYTITNGNTLMLNLDTVSGEDGGFYQCDCDPGYSGFCVLVYARPVFASCPDETDGCSDETLLTTMAGENVDFNATVMYAPGGSCDFQQEISDISLTKRNETFGGSDTVLYNCPTGEGEDCTTEQSDRVTLSRGNRPGLNFIFTLSDTIYGNDSGLYIVNVSRVHPATMSKTTFSKQFRLRVDQVEAPTGPTPTNPSTADERTSSFDLETTMAQTSSSDLETTMAQTSSETTMAQAEASNIAGPEVIAAAVLVPLALIVLVVLGILLLAVRWKHVFHKQAPPEEKEGGTPLQKIPQEETDTGETMNGLHDTAKLEVVERRQLPLKSTQIQPGNEPGEIVVQWPPENPRQSFIENAMHELPVAVELPLTDDEKNKFLINKQTSLQSESVVV